MKIKVGFIGNTCNYAFWYSKYLQNDSDIFSKCFIEYTKIERDYPWWDDSSINKDSPPSWMFLMPYFKFPGGLFSGSKSKIVLDELRNCDIIHAFGLISAIWALKSNKPYIYHSYGDIMTTPFIQKKYSINNWIRVIISRIVLAKARKVFLSQTLDIDFADKLRLSKKVSIIPLFYDANLFSKNNYLIKESFSRQYDEWSLIFYSPSRHIQLKRQDKVINCFYEFLKLTRRNALLILTEWGDLVEISKSIIENLGIKDFVKWIPCQTKEGMANFFQLKNLAVLDEFEDPPIKVSFGGVSRDALSMECVLITSIDKTSFLKLHSSLPPILWTDHTESSILQRMILFSNLSLDERIAIGKNGRAWLEKEHDFNFLRKRYLSEYIEIIKSRL